MYRPEHGEVARTVLCPRCKAPVTVARTDDTIECATCDGKFLLQVEHEQALVRSVESPSTALARPDGKLIAVGAFVAVGAILAVAFPSVGGVVLGVGILIGLLMRGTSFAERWRGKNR